MVMLLTDISHDYQFYFICEPDRFYRRTEQYRLKIVFSFIAHFYVTKPQMYGRAIFLFWDFLTFRCIQYEPSLIKLIKYKKAENACKHKNLW